VFSRRLQLRRNQSGGLVEADPLCLEKCQGDQDQGVLQEEGQGLRVSEVFTQDLLHDRGGHQEDQGQGTIQGLQGDTLGPPEDVLEPQEGTQGHLEDIQGQEADQDLEEGSEEEVLLQEEGVHLQEEEVLHQGEGDPEVQEKEFRGQQLLLLLRF